MMESARIKTGETGLPLDTEPTAASRSFRTLVLGPSKSFSQSPRYRSPLIQKSTKRPSKLVSFLKISPRIAPRAVLDPLPAIKSLLLNAPLSHYNFMAGSYRSPHKYDHFHEKTFIYSFIPSFRAGIFAHHHFALPPEPMDSSRANSVLVPRVRKEGKRTKGRKIGFVSANRMPNRPLPNEKTEPGRLSPARKVRKRVQRPILCLEDGETFAKADIRPQFIDFQEFIERYIGPSLENAKNEVFDQTKISLKSQALLSLLETVTERLKPKSPYISIFLVNGSQVEDLSLVPPDCQVLLFSSSGEFQGVRDITKD